MADPEKRAAGDPPKFPNKDTKNLIYLGRNMLSKASFESSDITLFRGKPSEHIRNPSVNSWIRHWLPNVGLQEKILRLFWNFNIVRGQTLMNGARLPYSVEGTEQQQVRFLGLL